MGDPAMTEPTLAQLMGYPANARLLIVHADDVGMCVPFNEATEQAMNMGTVTCGSVMTPCPGFEDAVRRFARRPEFDLGVHLTLTSEWRTYRWGPLTADESPGLVDAEGFFHRRQKAVWANATPQEAEREFRAQIDRAMAHGFKPTHLDNHMGTVTRLPFLEVYFKVAADYRIPPLVARSIPVYPAPPEGLDMARRYGFPILDSVAPVPYFGPVITQWWRMARILKRLPPGVSQMVVHLAPNMRSIRHIVRWHPIGPRAVKDFQIVTSPRFKRLLERLDIRLIGWREVMEFYRNGGAAL